MGSAKSGEPADVRPCRGGTVRRCSSVLFSNVAAEAPAYVRLSSDAASQRTSASPAQRGRNTPFLHNLGQRPCTSDEPTPVRPCHGAWCAGVCAPALQATPRLTAVQVLYGIAAATAQCVLTKREMSFGRSLHRSINPSTYQSIYLSIL